jgi:hypothetical protein
MATSKSQQILKDIEETALLMTELKKIEDDYYNKLFRRTAIGKKQLEQSIKHYKLEIELRELMKKQASSNKQLQKHLQKIIDQKKIELNLSGKINRALSHEKKLRLAQFNADRKALRLYIDDYNSGIKMIQDFGTKLSNIFTNTSSELLKIDHEIKQTILGISLSGERAAYFRDNLNQAAIYTSMIGVNAADLAKMQKSYADETGRALILSKENLIAVSDLAKGTLLGAEGASKIVGAFELIGYGAKDTVSYFEDVVNLSQKSGVNADKVVKRISENFKKSQNYSFRNGIRGLAEMSKYAEKFKNDIGSTFSAMDKARTLEGAIDMASNLQVIGGQFANSDPFQLLHLSRNDPQKFQKMLNEMTRGVAQFNKTSGEIEITSLNLDRLRMVAEATGQDFNNLVEQSKQFAKVSTIERNLFGLSPEDKELVSSLADINKKTMKWEIDGTDITKLSKTQIDLLRGHSQTLHERAEASITFDKQMVYLVDSLKATLLPLLTYVNKALDSFQAMLKPVVDIFSKHSGIFQIGFGMLGVVAAFKTIGGIVGAMTGAFKPLLTVGKELMKNGGLVAKSLAGVKRDSSSFSPTTSYANKRIAAQKRINSGGGLANKMKGSAGGGAGGAGKLTSLAKGSTGSMLAFSAAIVSVGLAINLATNGIANMATAFEKLDANKIDKLNVTLGILGVTIIGTVVGGIIALGKAGEISAVGLGILAATTLAIGAGIGLATAGIGYLVNSISKFGDPAFATNISTLASNMTKVVGLDYTNTKDTFGVISDVLKRESAMKEFGNMINALKGLDNVNNPLSELKDMFSKPLRVEFDNKSVNLSVNVDMNLDGDKIFNDKFVKKVVTRIVNMKNGN